MNRTRTRWVVTGVAALVFGLGMACGPLPTAVSPMAVSKPVVTITSPSDGQTVPDAQDVPIQSVATDGQGVVRVELWVDGQLYRVDASPEPDGQTPFVVSQSWHAAGGGSHALEVRAYNAAGGASEPAVITLNVGEGAAPATPPATPTAPSPTATLAVSPLTATPTVPVPTATPTLPPRGVDRPPAVTILSPANGAVVFKGQEVAVRSVATDDVGVSRVELWADGAMHEAREVHGAIQAEVLQTWPSGEVGQHVLAVKAVDTEGQVSPVVSIVIKVEEPEPGGLTPEGHFATVWEQLGAGASRLGFALAPESEKYYARQPFEHALMYWRDSEDAPDVIYVLVYDSDDDPTNGWWYQFEDTWVGGQMPEKSCDLSPPASRHQPLRGFGKLWCERSDVRGGIGWALEPERGESREGPVMGGYQDFQGGTMLRDGLKGRIYVLNNKGDWQSFSE